MAPMKQKCQTKIESNKSLVERFSNFSLLLLLNELKNSIEICCKFDDQLQESSVSEIINFFIGGNTLNCTDEFDENVRKWTLKYIQMHLFIAKNSSHWSGILRTMGKSFS